MGFEQKILQFLSIVGFLLLASCSAEQKLNFGDLFVDSDCVTPAVRGESISVSSNEVVAPVGKSYLDYGFPDIKVFAGVPVEGVVGSVQRLCQLTYGKNSSDIDTSLIFSCFDNNRFSCTIVLEK